MATPALAHHISGNVYCDQDLDGTIDVPGDTPIPSITVQATSLDFNPGELFSAMTDGSGAYFIALPPRTDLYRVELINLPPGYTVVVPVGGSYDIQIITGTSQDRAEGVNFLVQGCAETTTTSTTTSTSTTTTSTTTSSTTTTSTSTTTTTTSSTTTTTVQVCECDTAFLVRSRGKFNNGATIVGSVVANDLNGSIKFGKQVNVADDTTVIGDTVRVGNGSSIDDVLANDLRLGPGAVVRGSTGVPTLPVITPFCEVPAIVCGTSDVLVPPGQSAGPLTPGTYGRLRVLDGGSITLDPGQFTFCEIKTGRQSSITTLGPATLDVAGRVTIGTASVLGPAQGTDPIPVNVAGRSVRVSASAMANAAFVAPNARISFGRDARLLGCFCTDMAKSDKGITLECAAQ